MAYTVQEYIPVNIAELCIPLFASVMALQSSFSVTHTETEAQMTPTPKLSDAGPPQGVPAKIGAYASSWRTDKSLKKAFLCPALVYIYKYGKIIEIVCDTTGGGGSTLRKPMPDRL